MPGVPYFFYPFGVDGDLTVVPVTDPGDGSVSYESGFGYQYSLPQTSPLYRFIPRDQTNEIFYDITLALQQYQNTGIPLFITTAANLGTPYSYPIAGINVLYTNGSVYQTKHSAVTSTPGTNADWRLMDLNAAGLIIDNVAFGAGVTQGMAVYYNVGTSKYSPAIANGGAANQVVGFADVTNSRVLLSGYNLSSIFSGGTIGVPYYLSGTTPGSITTTPPTLYVTPVGTFATSTLFLVNISNIPLYTGLVAKRTQTAVQGFLGSNTQNVILFNANQIMVPASFISGNGFMMPWNGKYRFSAVMSVFTNQNGTNFGLFLRANSASLVSVLSFAGQGGAQPLQQNMSGSDILVLTAGTLIELIAIFTGTIGGTSIAGNPPITSFSVEYLGQ